MSNAVVDTMLADMGGRDLTGDELAQILEMTVSKETCAAVQESNTNLIQAVHDLIAVTNETNKELKVSIDKMVEQVNDIEIRVQVQEKVKKKLDKRTKYQWGAIVAMAALLKLIHPLLNFLGTIGH